MDEIMSITTDKLGKGVHILLALFLIGIVTGLMSCTNELPADHPKVEKEMVPIQFKLSRGLGGGGGDDGYDDIWTIRILEFRTDGTLENQWISEELDDQSNHNFGPDHPYVIINDVYNEGESQPEGQIFEIEPSNQDKTVVVVANETYGMTDYFRSLPLNSTHLKDVRAHLVSDVFGEDLSYLDYSYPNHMVMVGERKHPAVKGVVNDAKGVLLNRILAKVTLHIKKAEEIKEVPIEIDSVKLTKLNSGSKLLDPTKPTENTIEETFGWFLNGNELPVNDVAPLEMGTIYTYERRLPNDANGEKEAPVLVVKATYNGIPTVYKAHLYAPAASQTRANQNKPWEDEWWSLCRNTHYNITATIKGLGDSGLLIQTVVAPWKYVKYEEKYEELVFLKDETGQDFPMGKNVVHYIDNNQPIKVKVRIKGYPGTKWKATLSNGYDFTFDGDSWGKADGKAEVTITIKPRYENITKEKRTKVYFTVDGDEVPGAYFEVVQKPKK